MSHAFSPSSAPGPVPPSPPTSPTTDPPEPGGRLAGRRAELDRLDALLGQTRQGRCRVVQVSGEPGIGKTRLLEELAVRGTARGYTVLTGRAAEFEELPFGALADALRTSPGPDVPVPDCTWLSIAFPALARGKPPAPSDMDSDRYRLYRTVATLLAALAGDHGLVFALDDLHWADAGTVELLDYLLRHPPRAPVLLALAYRRRQASPRLLATMAQAAEQACLVLDLPPLAPDEMDELLPAGVSGPRRHELHTLSGGNPLYLDLLVRGGGLGSPTAGVDPVQGDDALGPVAAALAGELAALPAPALALARAAAIAGDVFAPELVSSIAQVPVSAALAGLDELAGRDIVRLEPTGRRFRFRHPLVRNAIYHLIGGGSLREGHARAAGHLQQAGATAMVRAHHVERAARAPDTAAAATLVAAAEQTLGTVPALAGHWLGAAAGLLPATEWRRRCQLQLRQAAAVGATGRYAESRDLAREALAPLGAEWTDMHARGATLCATMERLLGRHDDAVALLTDALARVPDPDGGEAALLKFELAQVCALGGRLVEAMDWTAQARSATAGRADRALARAGTAGLLALGNAYAGDHDSAIAHLDEAAPLLDGVTDGELTGHLSVVGLAWAELSLHRFADAHRHFARGVALARRSGQHQLLPPMLCGLCNAEIWQGRLAEAAEHAADAAEFARALGDREWHPVALGGQAEVAYMRGELAEAARYAREAIATRPPNDYLWSGLAEGILAMTLLAEGDPVGCVDELLAAGGGPDLLAYVPGMRAIWYDVLAQAELARDRLDAAVGWADRSQAIGPVFGAAETHLMTRARILVAAGEPVAAVAPATAVIDYAVATGMPIVEGDVRRIRAAALAACGHLDRAEDDLRRAKVLYAGCGARRKRDEVVADQRRQAAAKPRPGVNAGTGALTPRESEIAGLVAAGHTNRQIADRLAMSPRTVETHLSRIFAKFDVSSRAGLARRIAEKGRANGRGNGGRARPGDGGMGSA